jgi:hypothetical protein
MMKKNHSQWWSEIDALENKALGVFAGGLLLDTDANALSKRMEALPPADFDKVETLLESMGARRLASKKAETVDDMKKEITLFFETNAQVAMLAARSFESLPDETVKTIYDQLLDLQQRARRRG